MSITVGLRIVGLFFSQSVTLNTNRNLSVKDVLDAYVSANQLDQPNGLDYDIAFDARNPNELSLLAFTYNYPGTFQPSAANPCGLTIGNKIRPAGIYRLQELVLDPIVVAWQYYVIDKATNENKTKTKPGEGFLSFNTPLTGGQKISDGDIIIWRMVAIARRPNVVKIESGCPQVPESLSE